MHHGGNIYKASKMLTCKSSEIIDFSSNINLYHPKSDIKTDNEMIVKYAESSYKNLKKTISEKYNLKSKEIALFNGATSAIYELFRYLKPLHVTLYSPLYSEYESAAKLSNKKIHKINRLKNIYKKPKKGSIVVFVNPSTPDAKFYKLKKLFKIWKEQNCTVILDESFLEFEDLESERWRIKSFKKLYIIQSFSKFYSCAGVRVGAIFSHKKNIKKLVGIHWNLSSFDVKFLEKRLKDREFAIRSRVLHVRRKKELYSILKSSKLFEKIYKSHTNFFLVKSKYAKQIYKESLKDKILLRQCGNFDYLDKEYLRFAIKDKKSHNSLKKVLHALS
jgi:threonine-phosphate decarboxylase